MYTNDVNVTYANALEEYRKVGDVISVYKKLFDEIDGNYLNGIEHVISIGPGPGTADILFLNKTAPNLMKFTAVEKDASCMEALKENIAKEFSTSVTVDLHLSVSQHWQGPREKADLVLMFHSLYYFNEEERKEIYKKCFNHWLKPNGKLFVLLHKDLYEATDTFCLNDILRETGRTPHIEAYTIKKELASLGYVVEKVYNYEYRQDLQALHDNVVSFIMIHANPPFEDEDVVRRAIKKLIEDGNKGYTSGNLFSVVQQL
ncbi:hypothetical protein HELRODRAFT_177828 [Helobdella robusta]|uniref:Methyltransferase domain-containing protein n=1 Tax=Helobdella robusta TaxID=6412 RepID=T1FCC1_HELRO|nr:hypothetical protein HELRODRAFT_177828 [Helobdella robusta]ESN97765.1 hypothetical protein HELRODRAFT_177828 [Helobdella robusta]